jgi:hypothetical protein
MKRYKGHIYETVEDWHPVVIKSPTDFYDKIVYLPSWLSEHCPGADDDYDAYVYADDSLMDANHRSIYFFRDETVAILFALRWA